MEFEDILKIDLSDKTEDKDGLTYLSWAFAWAEFKKIHKDAKYNILKDENNKCYFGDDEIGYMVYTSVYGGGESHDMFLPILDGANKAMKRKPYNYTVKNKNFRYATLNKNDGKYYDKYGNVQEEFITKTVEGMTMFDVNKALMRCLVKNISVFGLGLYIYAGLDLPEIETDYVEDKKEEPKKAAQTPKIERKVERQGRTQQEEKKVEFEPLTKAELVQVWGIKNVEETVVWFEGKFGKEMKNFDMVETEKARIILQQRKEKKEQEAKKAKEALEKIDGDLPFNV